MAKNQVDKVAGKKGAGSKVLAFNLGVTTALPRSNNALEQSNLQHLGLEAHCDGQHYYANIPLYELPAAMIKAEEAERVSLYKQPDTSFAIYESSSKPMFSKKNENGDSLLYDISISYKSGTYDAAADKLVTISPVCLTIKNSWSPAKTRDDGSIDNGASNAYGFKQISFYMTIDKLNNLLKYCYDMGNNFKISMMTRGVYDEALGIITVTSEDSKKQTEAQETQETQESEEEA